MCQTCEANFIISGNLKLISMTGNQTIEFNNLFININIISIVDPVFGSGVDTESTISDFELGDRTSTMVPRVQVNDN